MKTLFSRPFSSAAALLAVLVLAIVWNNEYLAPKRQAQKMWRENEQVIREIASGKGGTIGEFQDACHFFSKLTGIPIPHDYSSYLGAMMPNKDTVSSLEPLRQWYSENQDRLYWDEEQGEVRLKPE